MLDGYSRMTIKGQVTIPARLREALQLKEGDEVRFVLSEGALIVTREPTIRELAGSVPYSGPPEDWQLVRREYEQAVADEVGAEMGG
jgi:AbrB family looped-hinge helix DNA binding protein